MTAPELMPDCPTEETLAAFVDDQLDPAQRTATMEHLVTCGHCRELVLMAADVKMLEAVAELVPLAADIKASGELDAPAELVPLAADLKASGELARRADLVPHVVTGRWRRAASVMVPGRFGGRGWLSAAGVAAAAVVVMVAVTVPQQQPPFGKREMSKLAKASASLEYRPTQGRLAGDFPHRKVAPVFRGTTDEADSIKGLNAEVLGIAAETKDPHVLGVALLLSGDRQARAGVIGTLEKAQAQAKSDDERDAVDLDLAAALLGNGSIDDAERAFTLSDGVWRRSHQPVAAWNRAVALQMLIRDDDTRAAKQAWKDYLALDSTSEWADEARQKLTDIDERGY